MGEYTGKVVVITGASRGIGRAIAVAFAREGAQTVLAASSAERLAGAAEAIRNAGGLEPLTVAGDLRQLDKCEAVHRAVSEKLRRCDVLVNCAGATKAGAFVGLADEDWRDGFDLKFFSAVRLARLFWPMLKETEGKVLNVIGGTARTPNADMGIVGSVNAAMANFNKSLSALGKQDGVNVNAIHPGMTETERYHEILEQRSKSSGRPVEELRAERLASTGLRRLGQPEDIAELAVFLCSSRAGHIQGVAVAVDGGQTPGVY